MNYELIKIGFQLIFNIILCFTVENLEWEFKNDDDRQWVDISNCGKTVRKKSGGGVLMRLNNEIKINLKYEINVRVSELQNDAVMWIGLVNSENWNERIYYDHYYGKILDNEQEIKTVNTKLNKNSMMTFQNTVIRKTNNNEHIFKVSFTINGKDSCELYYQDVKPKIPFLWLADVVEVDVEVISKILIIFLRS